jgi:hypothetical protein
VGTRRQRFALLGLFLLSLPLVTTRIYSSDEIQYFAYLRSLWFDRDLSFENEYRYFYDRGIARSDGFHETFLERTTEAGRRVNFGTIGCAILWSPFYLVGDVAARLLHAAGRAVEIDGFSRSYIAAVAYGSAFYGAAALALAMSSAALLGLRGLAAAIAVWLGTPLLFYMYVAPPMSHACSAFAVALFVYVWLRVRRTWSPRGAAALGAAGALMAMVREQDLFFIVGPVADFAIGFARRPAADNTEQGATENTEYGATENTEYTDPRTYVRAVVAAVVSFAVVFAPQAIAYLRLNGHLGPSRLVTRKMTWTAPHALQVLASPEHGFFVWTPLAAVALGGLIWMILGRRRRIAVCMLLMYASQVYVSGSVESWTVAGGYGQRRFVALTSLLVIGLAALQEGGRRVAARRTVAVLTVIAIYWNIALIAEFGTGLMDRQRLSPAHNAYDAFVTLPREAPSLVYRYLFDRSSFYRPHSPERRE